MPIRKRPATTRVPQIVDAIAQFPKQDVADMLGAPLYQISRDTKILWGERAYRASLSRAEVKTIYCVTLYRHLQYAKGRHQIPESEIIEFINHQTDAEIWAVVALAGGSEADCNVGIEEMLMRQNQRRIQQDTINVQSTVA
ncbi:MAG: hypothetical protein ACTS2F_07845 [Thainema sp.]